MRLYATMAGAMAAIGAFGAPMATTDYVNRKVAEAKPGGYEAVSNAAMEAVEHAYSRGGNPHGVTAADVDAWPASEGRSVWAYLTDKSFRVTVTNYDSTVHAPMLFMEYRLEETEPWRLVWRETDALDDAIATATNLAYMAAREAAQKPEERAWGKYDSLTGEAVPEGVVQVTADAGLMVGGAMGWTGISGTQYWVLTSTDPTLCATGAEGKFSIKDADGNSAIEVVKSDKKLVPAIAEQCSAAGGVLTVKYAVTSDVAPVAEAAAEVGGPWHKAGEAECPAACSWTGGSGNWTLTANFNGAPKGFIRAMFEQGGDSYVNIAARGGVTADKVRIGGKTYAVAVETVNGKQLMVLTEVQ